MWRPTSATARFGPPHWLAPAKPKLFGPSITPAGSKLSTLGCNDARGVKTPVHNPQFHQRRNRCGSLNSLQSPHAEESLLDALHHPRPRRRRCPALLVGAGRDRSGRHAGVVGRLSLRLVLADQESVL